MKKLSIIIIVAMLATAISCKKDEVKPVASFTVNADSINAVSIILTRTNGVANSLICTNTSINAEKYVWVSSRKGTRDTTTSTSTKTYEYYNWGGACPTTFSLTDTITLIAIKGSDISSTSKVVRIKPTCSDIVIF